MNAPTNVAALAPTVKLLIGGQFVESQTTEWRDVVAFVLLVLVLMFRPTGILGESLGRARA